MRLLGTVAIVTGGANGIGRATVQRLADEGATVVIADVDSDRMRSLANELSETGHQTLPVLCDLTRSEDVGQMVETAISALERIDVLVNCAGGSGMSPFYKTEEGRKQRWTEEIPEAEWDTTFALNLTAPFLCCKYVIPHMKQQGRGRIVNFSSIGADIGMGDSSFAYAAYAAAKAGIIGLTHQLAAELGPFGISVNCICPGAVLSERIAARFQTDWKDTSMQAVSASTPLRRMARPEEVAAAVAFLASEDASFVSGITLDVNGGRYFR